MLTVRTLDALRAALAGFRAAGARVALVPTMGALHAGHMALVEAARVEGTRVVASIFVNPKQFGPNEDLARYPRQEAEDAAMLAGVGCDLLWAPAVEVMYPAGFASGVSVGGGLTDVLDGAARPGHFDGVATVVAKLFAQARPDIAYFGEKDWQQLAVVRRMAIDLDTGVEVVGVPTVREADGLALSSRNAYLSAEERERALVLPRALSAAAAAIAGGDVGAALGEARAALARAGFVVDYVELVDAGSLGKPVAGRARRLLAAARIGGTRLIDNMAIGEA
jgi:pantoate--beta-alanine ligase